MKKYFQFTVSIFLILFIVVGCASEGSLELKSVTVQLSNDEERLGATGITSGERKGEYIVPIALSYDVILQNTGKNQLGNLEKPNQEKFKYDDGIEVNIEPDEQLKELSIEIMGFDIYSANELGLGQTFEPILEPNQEGEYTFDFELGALEENPNLRLAPSMEELEKLKKHALDANLIVTIEGEEIARFDLNEFNTD